MSWRPRLQPGPTSGRWGLGFRVSVGLCPHLPEVDALIDGIVYKLYGLTEKEIGLAAEVAAWPDLREVGIRFSS